jgi:hypothetical protein
MFSSAVVDSLSLQVYQLYSEIVIGNYNLGILLRLAIIQIHELPPQISIQIQDLV